jgi:3-oxo-5-alpha-steroid 4-dehydrogenase 1
MNELNIYFIILFSFLTLGCIIFIMLFFFPAPYGRYATKSWGPFINNRVAWVVQEMPAFLMMFVYCLIADRPLTAATASLLCLWQIHFFHRTFIYPFTLRGGKPVPLVTVLSAITFYLANTYVQGRWLFTLSPEDMYTTAWLTDPRFISGTILFMTGYVINRHSDNILRSLRKPGESGYKIPRGGLFTYVSCPNYLGEIIIWAGWSIATWSLAGIYFLIWTLANLVPRARSHHRWYKTTFSDYPPERKILFPFIW